MDSRLHCTSYKRNIEQLTLKLDEVTNQINTNKELLEHLEAHEEKLDHDLDCWGRRLKQYEINHKYIIRQYLDARDKYYYYRILTRPANKFILIIFPHAFSSYDSRQYSCAPIDMFYKSNKWNFDAYSRADAGNIPLVYADNEATYLLPRSDVIDVHISYILINGQRIVKKSRFLPKIL